MDSDFLSTSPARRSIRSAANNVLMANKFSSALVLPHEVSKETSAEANSSGTNSTRPSSMNMLAAVNEANSPVAKLVNAKNSNSVVNAQRKWVSVAKFFAHALSSSSQHREHNDHDGGST